MSIRYVDGEKTLVIGVGDLLAAGPRSGHLRLDYTGSQAARMAAGRAVHQTWQTERGASDAAFRAEVTVSVTRVVRGWECTVRGRLDGITVEADRTVVEEVKSSGLSGARLAATTLEDWPAWTSQLELYLWMLRQTGHAEPAGRLILVSLMDGSRHVLSSSGDAYATEAWVDHQLQRLVLEREAFLAWRTERRAASVPFAHDDFREGQDDVVASVEHALGRGKHLLMSAPTGTGKTAAVLLGALRWAYRNDKRVFFATAKGTQQRLVEETLEEMAARGLPLRAVSVRAREKACLHDVVDCRPESCPFARGYYDKVESQGLVDRVLDQGVARPDVVERVSLEHTACPFELQLDVSDRCDVVIGDYNYVFAPGAYLRRHFQEGAKDWIVVVDEAHNLVDRARSYGSPRLLARQASAAGRFLREASERAAPFAEICEDLAHAVEDALLLVEEGAPRGYGQVVVELSPRRFVELRDRVEELALEYLRVRDPSWPEDPYADVARELHRFCSVLEAARKHDSDAIVHLYSETRWEGPAVQLCCLDPALWVKARMASFAGSVLMSATLRPARFHQDLLGLEEERVEVVEHPSPFPPEHRHVVVAPRVSTLYRDRDRQRKPTARLLRELVESVPGTVAIYYPSFELLGQLQPLVEVEGREPLIQQRRMDEHARSELVAALVAEGAPRVLHAVLGGVFAEGVDLPTSALQAVICVGPALPRLNLQRKLFQAHCEARWGQGFHYAFVVPGMCRVVQAAGRVVRSPSDQGQVVLLGRRFTHSAYRELLPLEWIVRDADEPVEVAGAFWT